MPLALYMDHHVPRAITNGLRQRGIDVLTAEEDGSKQLEDAKLLDRATALNRILFTRDDDLLRQARKRQLDGVQFLCVVYAHQLYVSIGICISDLELICTIGNSSDIQNSVLFLPI